MTNERSEGNITRIYILVMYFVVVCILAAFAYLPQSGFFGLILSQLTPHLFYIPLVMTALWYPKEKLAHIAILCVVFAMLFLSYLSANTSLNLIFTVFISFIYLWVYVAIVYLGFKPAINHGDQDISNDITEASKSVTQKKDAIEAIEAVRVSAAVIQSDSAKTITLSPSDIQAQVQPQIKSPAINGATAVSVTENLEMHTIQPAKLIHHASKEEITGLISTLCVRDPEVVTKTFAELLKIKEEAEPYLIESIYSPNLALRENSAKALGLIHSEYSVPYLISGMDDSSNRMRTASIQAVASIGKSALPNLTKGLTDKRFKVRAGCCEALRIIGSKESEDMIISLLKDESHYVRKEAAKSLGRLGNGSTETVKSLCDALFDESRSVRIVVASSLNKLRSPESVTPLFERYRIEEDTAVRERILRCFATIGTPDAIKAMQFASSYEKDKELREAAKDYSCGFDILTSDNNNT